jgi:hypothetical protein
MSPSLTVGVRTDDGEEKAIEMSSKLRGFTGEALMDQELL